MKIINDECTRFLFQGEAESPVVFTSAETQIESKTERTIRLVDGPSPLQGRLQVLHNNVWRSVCTNSRKYDFYKQLKLKI